MRRLKGDTEEQPFRYRDLGTMATISWFHAVVSIGRVRVGGSAGWLMWLVVHLVFLTGFKNRFAAVLNWASRFSAGRAGSGRLPSSRCSRGRRLPSGPTQ